MTLIYHEDVNGCYVLYNGDEFQVYGLTIAFIATVTIQGYQLWRSDDGRFWFSLIDGDRTEDGPYYPVLVRGDLGTGAFVLEALRVCVYGLWHEAWRPPVLTL